MPQVVSSSTIQFLTWVSDRPRTYADVLDVWRSTCPRLSVWEDALLAGLVEIERAEDANSSIIKLTPRGRAFLTNPV